MSEQEIIQNLVFRHWPDECEAVGQAVVVDIITGEHQLESVEGASYMDLAAIIAVVGGAVSVVKGILEIYKILAEKLHRKPTEDEVFLLVVEKEIGMDTPELTRKVVRDLSEHFDQL